MLFYYLKDPENDHYFEQLSLEVSAKIDVEIFEKAWNVVIETNEMLRTSFRWEKSNKPEAHLHGRTASPSSKYPTGIPDGS